MSYTALIPQGGKVESWGGGGDKSSGNAGDPMLGVAVIP